MANEINAMYSNFKYFEYIAFVCYKPNKLLLLGIGSGLHFGSIPSVSVIRCLGVAYISVLSNQCLLLGCGGGLRISPIPSVSPVSVHGHATAHQSRVCNRSTVS